jgi:hypothetical protein
MTQIEEVKADTGPPPPNDKTTVESPDKWFWLHLLVNGDPAAKIDLGFSPKARKLLANEDPIESGGNVANALSPMIAAYYDQLKPGGDK